MKKRYLLQRLILGFYFGVISCNSDNNQRVIGLNENIHHDDFEYSVTSFDTTHQIIGKKDTIFAKDIFYLVTFKVTNNALRVGHNWNNSIAFIIDENGNRYENIEEDQDELNESEPFGLMKYYNTPHGYSSSTILVFQLPGNVRKPYLMVKGETLMGDVFDAGKFKKMRIKLF
jgi:hypothetical protein